jgi:hypothetical protein
MPQRRSKSHSDPQSLRARTARWFEALGEGTTTQRVGFVLGLCALTLAPLNHGSVELSWAATVGAFLILAILLADVTHLSRATVLAAVLIAMLSALLIAAALLQNQPGFPGLPGHAVWQHPASLLGVTKPGRAAAIADQPVFSLGNVIAMTLAAFFGLFAGTTPRRALVLVRVVAWSAVMLGAYSFLEQFSRFWASELGPGTSGFTGTFYNRNTAATYFGSCATVMTVLALRRTIRWLRECGDWQPDASWMVLFSAPRDLVMLIAATAFLLIATLATASRAGALATLAAVLIVTMLSLVRWARPVRIGGIAAVVATLCIVLFIEIYGAGLGARLEAGLSDPARYEVYKATAQLIGEYPLTGQGLGTFMHAFPALRPITLPSWGIWEIAHSTPLELVHDIGLPLAGLTFGLWLASAVVLARCTLQRDRDTRVATAAFGFWLVGAMHSFVDFSLQLPGYAVIFAAVVSCGVASALTPIPERADSVV